MPCTLLSKLKRIKAALICVLRGAKVPIRPQEQLTQTLIVCQNTLVFINPNIRKPGVPCPPVQPPWTLDSWRKSNTFPCPSRRVFTVISSIFKTSFFSWRIFERTNFRKPAARRDKLIGPSQWKHNPCCPYPRDT